MIQTKKLRACCLLTATLLAVTTLPVFDAFGQSNYSSQQETQSATVDIDSSINEIKLIMGTSRVLRYSHVVPDFINENQETVQATPITANQILITGKKLGFSSITVSDDRGNPHTLNIHVMGDVRKLEATLRGLFPDSSVRATALNTSVVLQGNVASANQVPVIVDTAKDFFPEVHDNMTVGDSQLVAIEVKVYEVSRSRLRQAGIDWSLVTSDFNIASNFGQAGAAPLTFNVLNSGTSFTGFLDLLEQNTLAKLLDAPVLVTMNGRPAEFLEGGEIPFELNQGLGNTTIEFRPFGTKLDVVPIVLGQNRVRLEIRAEVSEPAADLTSANGTPGFRVRRVNTGVEMKMGHTLALAGDYREETEATSSGLPGLKHVPGIGGIFRRVQETKSELELVILMTPRYISEVDPNALPPVGPGELTSSPSNSELYINGTIEVPKCEEDCPGANGFRPSQAIPFNGSNNFSSNYALEERPNELPEVLQNYQKNFPGSPVGQQSQGFGFPNSSGQVQNEIIPNQPQPVSGYEGNYQNSAWPSSGNNQQNYVPQPRQQGSPWTGGSSSSNWQGSRPRPEAEGGFSWPNVQRLGSRLRQNR